MQSMMLTGIRKMEMMNIPDPEITDGFSVKIRMKVIGVCGSDMHYYVNGKIGSQIIQYPFPVGHEGAGIVVDVGKHVTRVRPGDRVAIEPAMPCFECDQCTSGRPHTCRNLKFLGCPDQAPGCLSEYILMPETSCFPVSNALSYDEAALSEPLSIGVYAVRQSKLHINASVGILGFGPIGMSVMLAAYSQGVRKFYVTDLIDNRLERAMNIGATWSGNPDKADIVNVIKLLEPKGLDVVFDCCGKQEAMNQAMFLLKPGGKIMMVGIPDFDNWCFNADMLRRNELILINIRRQNHALEEALQMISSGEVNVRSMVTHHFPFEQTKDAFDLVAGYGDKVMKAMIYLKD